MGTNPQENSNFAVQVTSGAWSVGHSGNGFGDLSMTDNELLGRIARSAGQRCGYKQLVRELGLGGGRERRLLLEQLARLTASGRLVKVDGEHWGLPSAARGSSRSRDWVSGRLDLHRD